MGGNTWAATRIGCSPPPTTPSSQFPKVEEEKDKGNWGGGQSHNQACCLGHNGDGGGGGPGEGMVVSWGWGEGRTPDSGCGDY